MRITHKFVWSCNNNNFHYWKLLPLWILLLQLITSVAITPINPVILRVLLRGAKIARHYSAPRRRMHICYAGNKMTKHPLRRKCTVHFRLRRKCTLWQASTHRKNSIIWTRDSTLGSTKNISRGPRNWFRKKRHLESDLISQTVDRDLHNAVEDSRPRLFSKENFPP